MGLARLHKLVLFPNEKYLKFLDKSYGANRDDEETNQFNKYILKTFSIHRIMKNNKTALNLIND